MPTPELILKCAVFFALWTVRGIWQEYICVNHQRSKFGPSRQSSWGPEILLVACWLAHESPSGRSCPWVFLSLRRPCRLTRTTDRSWCGGSVRSGPCTSWRVSLNGNALLITSAVWQSSSRWEPWGRRSPYVLYSIDGLSLKPRQSKCSLLFRRWAAFPASAVAWETWRSSIVPFIAHIQEKALGHSDPSSHI